MSSIEGRGKFFAAKAAKIDSDCAHRGDDAGQLSRRLSNRAENTLNLAMEIVRLQRKVLALDERVLLVEEEALIERMENQHNEAGGARKGTGLHKRHHRVPQARARSRSRI